MLIESLPNNRIVSPEAVSPPARTNGVPDPSTENDSTLVRIIRAMYEGEHGSNGGTGYYWRRGLQTSLTPSFFRRFDVLLDLTLHYRGDIPLAIRDTFPTPAGKPLLQLDDPRPMDPLYQQWQQREEELEEAVNKARTFKQPVNAYFFRERKVGKRGGFWITVKTRETHMERKWIENWYRRENSDLNKAISTFVRPGDTVASFLSGHDPILTSLIAGRLRGNGELYVVTPGPYLEEGLFANFLGLLMDFEQAKGEREKKTEHQIKAETFERRLTGSGLVSAGFRAEASDFLSHPYRYNERFYREGLNWQDTLLMQRFFEHFHIHPLRMEGAVLPSGIPSRSLDAIVEADRFAVVPEEDIESVLYEIDRVLRPGGHLIFREGSRQQASIEYYGLELFEQHYRRLTPPGIKSGQIVVMRKNLELGQIDRFTISTPSNNNQESASASIRPNSRKGRLIRQAREALSVEIYAVLQEQQANSPTTLSLSWFRSNGHLPLLISEYGGSVEKAIEEAKKAYETKRPTTGDASISRPPEGAKPVYTIDDLAQEFGTSKSQIRKAIDRMGIKAGSTTSYAGQSGFTKRSVASRQLNFSYREYVVLRNALKDQKLKPRNQELVTKPRGQ